MSFITSGTYTSDGATKYLELPYGTDYLEIDNYTTLAAGGAATGVSFVWQRGMTADYDIEYTKLAADESITKAIITTGGFTEYKSSDSPTGALNATITAVTAAAVPLVELGNTHTDNIQNGDVVRLINVTGAQQLGGIDFTVGSVTLDTEFTLANMDTIVAGTTGSLRKVKYAPLFYPVNRTITKVRVDPADGTKTQVTLSVTHGYVVGQKVSFVVPSAFGMIELNGLTATISNINTADADAATNTVIVDIDCSAFTAFAWPVTADDIFTPAQMIPEGRDITSTYIDGFPGATYNKGTMGMILAAGTHSPNGIADDVIYWRAYKNDNE